MQKCGKKAQNLDDLIQDFGDWGRDLLCQETKDTAVSEPLYHYTDAAGLKGIVENQTIWFTDYRFLNDPFEFIHGIEHTIDIARLMSPSGEQELVAQYCSILRSMFASPSITHDSFSFFVASFSRKRDDLGQWRAYGDNGRGYSIGFGASLFAAKSSLSDKADENVFVGPVVYDMAFNERRISAVIDRAAQTILEATETGQITSEAERDSFLQELARNSLAAPLIWYALTAKSPAYQSEEEVRMIMLGERERLNDFTKVRSRGAELVPYVPHSVSIMGPPHLLEVLVGPAAPLTAQYGARTLLDARRITGVDIDTSTIPYRAF